MALGRKLKPSMTTCESTTLASTSRASSSGVLLLKLLSGRWLALILSPINFSAWRCVRTPSLTGSSSDGAYLDGSPSSLPTNCTISWSDSMPIALNTMPIGMSSPNVLCFKYSRPFFTKILHRDFRSWVEDVMAAATLPFWSTSMITRFFDSCSCIRITFSTPLQMKYPPGSNGHSLRSANPSSDFPASTHLQDRSIIGILPIGTLSILTTWWPLVNLIFA
mmetsp:Transcript_34666/g.70803  ORF Transcript_34666/g.70803 Transcript_34666/m.70803 type:complete len:221 (+) Transcript_34666:447-1109(+)